MTEQVDAGTFHGLLQYVPADNPIPVSKGRFAMFPSSLYDDGRPGFPLDAVPGLEGFRLIVKEKDGVKRFGLRHPNGKELTPMKRARMVQVWIGKQMKVFNTANLLASYILKEDVTDNEFGILIGKDGMVVESAADRVALVDELKKKCLSCRGWISRSSSGPSQAPSTSGGRDTTSRAAFCTRRTGRHCMLRLTARSSSPAPRNNNK